MFSFVKFRIHLPLHFSKNALAKSFYFCMISILVASYISYFTMDKYTESKQVGDLEFINLEIFDFYGQIYNMTFHYHDYFMIYINFTALWFTVGVEFLFQIQYTAAYRFITFSLFLFFFDNVTKVLWFLT